MKKHVPFMAGILSAGLLLAGCTVSSNDSSVLRTETSEISDIQKEKQKDRNANSESRISSEDTEAREEKKDFYISEIPDDIFKKMQGKSYKEDCTVPRSDLRYLHVLHVGFDKKTHEGELVSNKFIADDLLNIFKKLYESKYEIEKIRLVDEYDADDETSMRDNNSSCFNFRFISHTTRVSKHGLGLAIDINTLYNPYIKVFDGETIIEPATAKQYTDRSKDFPHKIDENDPAYKLFTEYGFEWGGSWSDRKDYQHFEVPDSVIEKNNLR